MAIHRDTPKELDNSGNKPLHVPGFGCPYKFQFDLGERFVHGVSDAQYPRITAREVAMLKAMDQLTDKPDWRKKVFDKDVVAKWKDEAKGMELISEKAFEWCIAELRDKAENGSKLFTITLDAGARCVKADGLVCEQLHRDLNVAIQPLLNAPVKDWHPGSNEQVLNLVHPSLYPLVYGRTRVLKSGQVELDNTLKARDDTIIAPVLEPTEKDEKRLTSSFRRESLGWSTRYQWLPCDVAFTGTEGLEVTITSYINNLCYRGHEKLYECVEKLISVSIPLWNEVLEVERRLNEHARTNQRIVTCGAQDLDKNDKAWLFTLSDLEENDASQEQRDKAFKEVTEYLKKPDRSENLRYVNAQEQLPDDWLSKWGLYQTAEWKFNRIRRVVHPEPFFGCTYEDWKQGEAMPYVVPPNHSNGLTHSESHTHYEVDIQSMFRHEGLQVVVKMAGIELTPEKPAYHGGNWHLEGMLNEHIVATAIYYFDVQNVTQSRIRYRQNAVLDSLTTAYEQDDFLPLDIVFDVDDLRWEEQIQEIGSIMTPQGRLLIFPNTRQHRVDPFELVDKTSPGHRRFIVLWLVDPHYRVLSTKNVPPQQHDWWEGKMVESIPQSQHLAPEIRNMIEEELREGTMTREQAEYHRLELMQERTSVTDEIHYFTDEYSFCEH